MNMANSHLKIMCSYVAAPQVHAKALKNPAMVGGPFVDYGGLRVDEISALIDRVTRRQPHMIAFAESVKVLDARLRSEAQGYSLEAMYQSIPRDLRGYVELVYDLNDSPSIRFLECLLYKSKYYDIDLQTLSLSLTEQDGRAFALSTPRLWDDKSAELNIPFADEKVDALFSLKQVPQSYGYIKERLQIPDGSGEETFKTFLTTDAPAARERFCGDGVRVRYFGHACVLLETRRVSILTDPVISYSYPSKIDRFTFEDLPDVIDYVVLTHGHQDHVMLESLLQLRHKTTLLIIPKSRGNCLEDPSLKLILQAIGFRNIKEMDEMETIEIEGGSITGLPFFGEHCDLNIATKMAHLVRLNNKSFLFAADSNNIEPMLYSHLFDLVGDIDVLYIGMECDGAPMSWIYGPLLTRPFDRRKDQSRRLSGSDYERGIGIVDQFRFKEVYVYAMGLEPWLTHVMSINYSEDMKQIVHSNRLVAECRRRGVESERLFAKREFYYPASSADDERGG